MSTPSLTTTSVATESVHLAIPILVGHLRAVHAVELAESWLVQVGLLLQQLLSLLRLEVGVNL